MIIHCAVVDNDEKDLLQIKERINKLSVSERVEFDCTYFLDPTDKRILNIYDLYIIDIDMPQLNGFQLTRKIYDINPDAVIIYCTQHDHFVFDSYRLNAFYFVRKSFLSDELLSALYKYLRLYSASKAEYIIKTADSVTRIRMMDIVYFEISHNDMFVHTEKKEYRQRRSLAQVIAELPSGIFLQVSQHYLINMNYISEISGNKAVLTTGLRFDIPRRNIKDVKEQFLAFVNR